MEPKVEAQLRWVVETLSPDHGASTTQTSEEEDASTARAKEIASALNTLQIMLRNAEQLHLPDHVTFQHRLPIALPLAQLADHPVDAKGALQAYLDFLPIDYILHEGADAILAALQWTAAAAAAGPAPAASSATEVDRSVENTMIYLLLDLYERRASDTVAHFHALVASTSLWREIKHKIAHPSEMVGQKAIRALCQVPAFSKRSSQTKREKNRMALHMTIFSSNQLYSVDPNELRKDAAELEALMQQSDATTFRVYDLLAQLAEKITLPSDVVPLFLNRLQRDITSSDPLLVLNAVESIHQVF